MKKNKLRGKIAEKGVTQSQCAEKLEISLQAFNAKLNGNVEFKLDEASVLGDFLKLTSDEKVDIFLN